jgi:hypothetical protein
LGTKGGETEREKYLAKRIRAQLKVLPRTRGLPIPEKSVGIPFIALLILAQAQLIIAAWAIEAKNIVSEVWANMDNTAYERTLIFEVEAPEDPAIIMEKIYKCELGGTHYKEDGTLIKNFNKNGTINFGKFQINSAWEPKRVRWE